MPKNPSCIRKACVLTGIAVAAGVAGAGITDRPAAAAATPDQQINPVAEKRPGLRTAELCTIDAVPKRGRRNRGFTFTGPAEFHDDGRITCYRARAIMRFRLGYSRLQVKKCSGRRYRIGGFRDGRWDLVTIDALTARVVSRKRVR